MDSQPGQFTSSSRPNPVPTDVDGSPLTEAHYAMIRQSIEGRAVVDRVAGVARKSGTSILVIGILSLVTSLFSWSMSAILVTVAICGVGLVELYGARRLKKPEPSACTMLSLNQAAFLAVIALYCAWQMLAPPAEIQKSIQSLLGTNDAQLKQLLTQMTELNRQLNNIDRLAMPVYYGFYGLVILLSAAFQGGLAIYYCRRKKYVDAYLQSTPDWIRRLASEMKA